MKQNSKKRNKSEKQYREEGKIRLRRKSEKIIRITKVKVQSVKNKKCQQNFHFME